MSMNGTAKENEAKLRRAALRVLGDTSDGVWCDNTDDVKDDAASLARNFLSEHPDDEVTILPVAELIRFNPIRNRRGVGAAEIRFGAEILWMTKKDIYNNIELFGPLDAFKIGLYHYMTNEAYP